MLKQLIKSFSVKYNLMDYLYYNAQNLSQDLLKY